MKKIWVVFIKEFLDIVRDRRRIILTLVSTFVLMPLMFVVPYAFIIMRMVRQASETISIPVQGMENAPALIAYLAEEADMEAFAVENVEELILGKQHAVGLIIPDDYEEKTNSGRTADVIVVADERRSMDVTRTRVVAELENYRSEALLARLRERGLTDDYLVPLEIKEKNVATPTETTGSMLGLIIPGIVLSFALSTGMPVAIAAVAGEKKKLTLEPVLFTTVSRFQLVFAKFLAVVASVFGTIVLMVASMAISALVFVIAAMRFMPSELMNAETSAETIAPSSSEPALEALTGGYHIQPLAIGLFLLAPFIIILLSAALQILVSSWARNDEEAGTYLAPLNFLAGGIVLVAFFLDELTPQLWYYAMPIFGTMLSMRDLLSDKIDPASLTVMFVSSILYAAAMLGLAVWMFHREEVVFRT